MHLQERATTIWPSAPARAISVLATPFSMLNMRRITDPALQHRLPAISWTPAFAEARGLMTYGPSRRELRQHVAALVAKILRGAKPADLPVEQPMRCALVIGLKTAQALGLTVPPILFFLADEAIR